jgi:hypothetical protein
MGRRGYPADSRLATGSGRGRPRGGRSGSGSRHHPGSTPIESACPEAPRCDQPGLPGIACVLRVRIAPPTRTPSRRPLASTGTRTAVWKPPHGRPCDGRGPRLRPMVSGWSCVGRTSAREQLVDPGGPGYASRRPRTNVWLRSWRTSGESPQLVQGRRAGPDECPVGGLEPHAPQYSRCRRLHRTINPGLSARPGRGRGRDRQAAR